MKQMSLYDEPTINSCGQMLYAVEDNIPKKTTTHQSQTLSIVETTKRTATAKITETVKTTETTSVADTGNVTEIIVSPEQAENIQMLLPMMTQLNQENRWLAWIDPPQSLLNRWQQQSGIIANQIMVLRSTETKSTLQLTQQALSAGTCHAVIAWTDQLTKNDFSQLEAASTKGNSHGVVMRYR